MRRAIKDRFSALQHRLKLQWGPILSGRTLSVEICNSDTGMFAQLGWCMYILHYCDRRGLKPRLSLTGERYRDPGRPGNWLSHFFDVDTPSPSPRVCFKIYDIAELHLPSDFSADLNFERAAELVRSYLPIQHQIREKVDVFWQERLAGRTPLAVHFRGTDKTDEAERVDWKQIKAVTNEYIRRNSGVDCLFVASDESAFIDYITRAFPGLPVISHEDRLRSRDGTPIYRFDLGSDNYTKGEEALINCLLLSRCSALIRTCSLLSAWACLFNPMLPMVLLNRPYAGKLWFVERLVMEKSNDQYVEYSNHAGADD